MERTVGRIFRCLTGHNTEPHIYRSKLSHLSTYSLGLHNIPCRARLFRRYATQSVAIESIEFTH